MNSKSAKGSSAKEEIQAALNNPFAKKELIIEQLEEEPELDELFHEVWGWFLKLNSRRSSNGFSINPITYTEIKSFFDLIQYSPLSWELDVIHLLDDIALKYYAEESEKKSKQKK